MNGDGLIAPPITARALVTALGELSHVRLVNLIRSIEEEVDDLDFTRRLFGVVEEAVKARTATCPYTHAHTRDWCGQLGCRKS